jgi:hypothetical protein
VEDTDDRTLVESHVAEIEVQRQRLAIHLNPDPDAPEGSTSADIIQVPWQKTPAVRQRELLLPSGTRDHLARPMRAETRATLLAAIARGRRWLDRLIGDPAANAASIAKADGCSARKVNMTISLAFLAPDLVKAAIEGRLPRGLGVSRLADLPPQWSRQHQMLGLPAFRDFDAESHDV